MAEHDSRLRHLEELEEDADDLAVLDVRKAELGSTPPLPAAVSSAMLRGDSLLKALREWKGVTQANLAKAASVGQGYLSDMENGKRTASRDTLARIAKVLGLPDGWLG